MYLAFHSMTDDCQIIQHSHSLNAYWVLENHASHGWAQRNPSIQWWTDTIVPPALGNDSLGPVQGRQGYCWPQILDGQSRTASLKEVPFRNRDRKEELHSPGVSEILINEQYSEVEFFSLYPSFESQPVFHPQVRTPPALLLQMRKCYVLHNNKNETHLLAKDLQNSI
jgi:hypothetical protein